MWVCVCVWEREREWYLCCVCERVSGWVCVSVCLGTTNVLLGPSPPSKQSSGWKERVRPWTRVKRRERWSSGSNLESAALSSPSPKWGERRRKIASLTHSFSRPSTLKKIIWWTCCDRKVTWDTVNDYYTISCLLLIWPRFQLENYKAKNFRCEMMKNGGKMWTVSEKLCYQVRSVIIIIRFQVFGSSHS